MAFKSTTMQLALGAHLAHAAGPEACESTILVPWVFHKKNEALTKLSCIFPNRCGSGDEYCAPGNCQEGDCEGGAIYSLDGRCGTEFDYDICPPKFGLCCSAAGL